MDINRMNLEGDSMYNKDYVEKNLMLYSIRKSKIEDMQLELEEMEHESLLNAQQYEESVQTSRQCNNNDMVLYKKECLEKNIKYYESICKRAENWINFITVKGGKDVIRGLCFLKDSKSDVAKKIDRTSKQVDRIYNTSIQDICNVLNAETL